MRVTWDLEVSYLFPQQAHRVPSLEVVAPLDDGACPDSPEASAIKRL